MNASLSFVIPALNEAENIAPLLRDLRARYPEAQLLVVDGESNDQTRAAARPHCDQLLQSAPGRALQMNVGARAATGDYVFFLHADSSPDVPVARLMLYLSRSPVWGFCPVQLSGDAPAFRVIEWFISWRSRLTRIATGDQMLFVRRELFLALGGYDMIPLMEDVALCKRLRHIADPLVLSEPVHTSSRRWERRGVTRTVLEMWALRFAYFAGVSPARLWRYYYGS